MVGERCANSLCMPRGVPGKSAMLISNTVNAKQGFCYNPEFIGEGQIKGVTASEEDTSTTKYSYQPDLSKEDSTDAEPDSDYDSLELTSISGSEHMHDNCKEFIGHRDHTKKYYLTCSEVLPVNGTAREIAQGACLGLLPAETHVRRILETEPERSVLAGGGGQGNYKHVDGDVPACFPTNGAGPLQHHSEVHSPGQQTIAPGADIVPASDKFSTLTGVTDQKNHLRIKIFQKNCRSLKSDDRVEELEAELDASDKEWAVIMLNETWRVSGSELWSTKRDNIFFGSGCAEGRRGTGILLNAKWKRCVVKTVAVSPRLCYMDLKNAWIHKIRLISAYFPDSTYSDSVLSRNIRCSGRSYC